MQLKVLQRSEPPPPEEGWYALQTHKHKIKQINDAKIFKKQNQHLDRYFVIYPRKLMNGKISPLLPQSQGNVTA